MCFKFLFSVFFSDLTELFITYNCV